MVIPQADELDVRMRCLLAAAQSCPADELLSQFGRYVRPKHREQCRDLLARDGKVAEVRQLVVDDVRGRFNFLRSVSLRS
jgi:hypothetical protein